MRTRLEKEWSNSKLKGGEGQQDLFLINFTFKVGFFFLFFSMRPTILRMDVNTVEQDKLSKM